MRKIVKGFLLFEVMVAVSVVGIGMAVVLQTISSSLAAGRMAGDYFLAGSLMSEKLWEINARGTVEPGATEGAFKEDARYHFTVTIEELFAETPEPVVAGAVPQARSLAKVTIRVSWEHRGKAKSLSAETFMPIAEQKMALKQPTSNP